MARVSIDKWEEQFCEICEKYLDEEPFYPYEHLWRKGLSPQEAFKSYLDENPDYAEKAQEINIEPQSKPDQEDFLALAPLLKSKGPTPCHFSSLPSAMS